MRVCIKDQTERGGVVLYIKIYNTRIGGVYVFFSEKIQKTPHTPGQRIVSASFKIRRVVYADYLFLFKASVQQ